MIDVYKLSGDGRVATLVGKVHKNREVGDKVRVKTTTSPLRVIGKGLSSLPGSHAIYCVTETDCFFGRTVFNETLFGYKDVERKQSLVSQIQSASACSTETLSISPLKARELEF